MVWDEDIIKKMNLAKWRRKRLRDKEDVIEGNKWQGIKKNKWGQERGNGH